jgi:uncharacterized protein (TIGR00730 family)
MTRREISTKTQSIEMPVKPRPRSQGGKNSRGGSQGADDQEMLTWTDEDRRQAAEFTQSDPWRVQRITAEFVAGFDTLADTGPAVSIFGSARVPEGDPLYEQARELGALLANAGVTVITGGGPGLMEATNRGAFEAGGESIGTGIELPFEQGVNDYVNVGLEFRYFFVRKMMFVKYASGFVFLPGGFGTLDELFEVLTLVQTGKMTKPIVLVGSDHWAGMVDWLQDVLVRDGRISAPDLSLFTLTDDIGDAARIMIDAARNARKRN